MKDLNQPMIPRIGEMLTHKDYNQLNPEEQAMVNIHMGKEEYNELRMVTLTAKQLLEEDRKLAVDPGLKQSLLNHYDSVYGKQTKARSFNLFTYKISVYQAGIAAGLLIFLALFFNRLGNRNSGGLETASQRDTIFIERLVSQPSPLALVETTGKLASDSGKIIARLVYSMARKDSNTSMPEYYDAGQVNNIERLVSIEQRSKKGRNALDDSLLLKLLVTVN